jgi:hypothetical protein
MSPVHCCKVSSRLSVLGRLMMMSDTTHVVEVCLIADLTMKEEDCFVLSGCFNASFLPLSVRESLQSLSLSSPIPRPSMLLFLSVDCL